MVQYHPLTPRPLEDPGLEQGCVQMEVFPVAL